MSEYGLGRETDAGEEPVATGGGEPWFERGEAAAAVAAAEPVLEPVGDPVIDPIVDPIVDPVLDPAIDAVLDPVLDPIEEPVEDAVEDYADPYADPQEWISSLIAKVERAEQGIGSGPRDALMARIKLAQAYSELGDTVQAAPLAVKNVAQARQLFPSSEGMLRQLREFRDAACEAAGWTAAMMRESEEEVTVEEPSELVTRPDAVAAAAEAAVAEAAMAEAAEEAEDFGFEHETPAAEPAPNPASQPAEAESVGAVIHEFVRRSPEPDALQWAAEVQAALTQPAELAIPSPPEPEYAEEVEPALASADLADLSDLADLAAIEEIIRLRYELREAQRTIERLRHVNRKLREALEYDEKA
ncbi:hypothetical protein [Catenulispora rubra]|uniref:hypothetical protein n=1 Tax=Catenulispora rubra TaxID=280293 RepID=UPI00189272A0|nr:hypothetical protein [Catenulispora rubra]